MKENTYITLSLQKVGRVITGVLAVSILICFIANLATAHTLNWFFIVLTSLLVVASISVVPLVVTRRRWLYTLLSFTVSLLILFMTCCLYTRGDWFFIASVGTLLGLSLFFMPYILSELTIKGGVKNHKGLISMLVDTILLYGLIVVCGMNANQPAYWRISLWSTTIGAAVVWMLFLIIRYARINGVTKAGICILLSGIISSVINDIIALVIDGTKQLSLTKVNLFAWNSDTINANIYMIYLLVGIVVGGILIVFGMVKRKNQI